MRLIELRPLWFAAEGRHGQGVIFDCPCGCRGTDRAVRLAVLFQPTLDGGEPLAANKIDDQFRAIAHTLGKQEPDFYHSVAPSGVVWARTGGTFDDLTLTPSIDYSKAGHWHGHIQSGEVK